MNAVATSNGEVPGTSSSEEDEEVRLAMEMALAAAKNPHLSPDELRKLVGEKNKQAELVNKLQEEKERKKQKDKEEAQKRWTEQKEKAYSWWAAKANAITQKAEELKFRAEKQYYADQIKQDKGIIAIRKKMKVTRKTLKAHRLQGNREETRHAFKRQRMEKKLIQTTDKLAKLHRVLTGPSFNVQEYAKAMMRASRKWKKRGSETELSYEAQLCQNMHQMLTVEKQKAKVKKSTRELKKYLQRCKSWLADKKAFCEMHLITLESTANTMNQLYEETLARQDRLIAKLKTSDEFKKVDLSEVDVSHLDLDDNQKTLGPKATLNALRGLPIQDSIRIKKDDDFKACGDVNGPELYVETGHPDDVSVNSNLSDPDEQDQDGDGTKNLPSPADETTNKDDDSESGCCFGSDAPWMSSEDSQDSNPKEATPKAASLFEDEDPPKPTSTKAKSKVTGEHGEAEDDRLKNEQTSQGGNVEEKETDKVISISDDTEESNPKIVSSEANGNANTEKDQSHAASKSSVGEVNRDGEVDEHHALEEQGRVDQEENQNEVEEIKGEEEDRSLKERDVDAANSGEERREIADTDKDPETQINADPDSLAKEVDEEEKASHESNNDPSSFGEEDIKDIKDEELSSKKNLGDSKDTLLTSETEPSVCSSTPTAIPSANLHQSVSSLHGEFIGDDILMDHGENEDNDEEVMMDVIDERKSTSSQAAATTEVDFNYSKDHNDYISDIEESDEDNMDEEDEE